VLLYSLHIACYKKLKYDIIFEKEMCGIAFDVVDVTASQP
jgi:hypothetical protein